MLILSFITGVSLTMEENDFFIDELI